MWKKKKGGGEKKTGNKHPSARDLPAVPDHADPLGLRHAAIACRLLQVLLASRALRVAKPGFGQRVGVAPTAGDFKAAQRQRLVLFDTPAVHVADAQLVDAERKLSPARLALLQVSTLAGADAATAATAATTFSGMSLVVGDFQTGRVGRSTEPLYAFLLIRSHTPAVAACQGVQEHGCRQALLGGDSKVVRRFFERSVLVQLDTFSQVFLGGQVPGWGNRTVGSSFDGAVGMRRGGGGVMFLVWSRKWRGPTSQGRLVWFRGDFIN